ncbi:MAG: hypothetical protein M3082_22120 [Candidatus Dormibacteraeota bacterium]|nr:hypothetical protein [Candidatus Dormibacteraeota bacterium]
METYNSDDTRIRARDRASRMLNRITAGAAFSAIAGEGLLGGVSAHLIPGTAAITPAAATATSPSASTSGSTSTSTSSGISASSGGELFEKLRRRSVRRVIVMAVDE